MRLRFRLRFRLRLRGCCRHHFGDRIRAALAMTGGVQPAQGLVERRQFADLRVIAKQRGDIGAVAQDTVNKALERFFRSDFDKDTRTGVVKCFEALDELHR